MAALVPKISYGKVAVAYMAWCLCWVVLQSIALVGTFDFPWRIALKDAAITNLVIAGAGYAMITTMRYYQPGRMARLVYSIALTLISLFIISKATLSLISGNAAYLGFFQQSLMIRGLYIWLMIALVSAVSWIAFAIYEQQEIEKRKSETEKLAREAELLSIRQQLQPHFLFNSLNSISALAGSKPEQARKMIQQLSDFLRGTLKKDDEQLVPLSEELIQLELYLEIEKVRFGHRLITNIEADDEAKTQKLPPLLLQPVVENAIKFGLYDTIGETVIDVRAHARAGNLMIVVKNPFDPGTSKPKTGTGFGLAAIQRRLYLIFGRQDLLATSADGHTFKTEITIPQVS